MEEIPLAADPFPALPELLRRPAGCRSTVLGQSPVGYWMLDDDSGGMLTYEIANEDDDAFLSSSRSIAAGRWHQVLASVTNSTAAITSCDFHS